MERLGPPCASERTGSERHVLSETLDFERFLVVVWWWGGRGIVDVVSLWVFVVVKFRDTLGSASPFLFSRGKCN